MGFFRDLVRRFLGVAEPEPEPEPSPSISPDLPEPPEAAPVAIPPSPPPELPAAGRSDFPAPRDEPTTPGPIEPGEPLPGIHDQIPAPDDESTRSNDPAPAALDPPTDEGLAEIDLADASKDRPADTPAGRKARAIERKWARAEAVAHRRTTEIAFLGRGVSRFLGDHQGDLAALEAAGLPALSTPGELAEAMGLTVSRLRWLAFHAEAATLVHYVTFEVPKKSGGTRTLSAPHKTLASAQRWVLARIVSRLPVEPEAHGFIAGRGILTNAGPHAGRAVVINLDLRDFFPNVGYRRVRAVFRRAGYSPSVATVLGLLCTECPRRTVVYDGTTYHVATGPRGLPQGASTSPGLSNQVARRLDRRLAGLARKLGATYTRYADDLTFSGDAALDPRVGYLLARARHLAWAEGFAINEAKTRVLRRNAAQVVTGLVVNDRPGVPRDEVRRLRAILHRAKVEGLEAQNREARPDFLAWLRGKIAYVSMARPEVGARLLADLEALGRG